MTICIPKNYSYSLELSEDGTISLPADSFEVMESMDESSSSDEEVLEPSLVEFDDEGDVDGDYSSKSHSLQISVDTEFTEKTPLSVQALVHVVNRETGIIDKKIKLMIINHLYKSGFTNNMLSKLETEMGLIIVFAEFEDTNTSVLLKTLTPLLCSKGILPIKKGEVYKASVDLLMYYSMKDLTIAFGLGNMLPYYLGKTKYKTPLTQRRNIRGNFKVIDTFGDLVVDYIFRVIDLYGLSPGGLKSLADSVGVEFGKKDLMKGYKATMDKALLERPNDFVQYSIGDVLVLPEIWTRQIGVYNTIIQDVLKVKDPNALFNNRTFPTTVGTIVYKVWDINYNYNILQNDPVIKLAMFKQGILDKMHKNYTSNLEAYTLLLSFTDINKLYELQQTDEIVFNNLYQTLSQHGVFLYSIIQYVSTKFLVSEAPASEEAILGMTTGGRTVNERPLEQVIHSPKPPKGGIGPQRGE